MLARPLTAALLTASALLLAGCASDAGGEQAVESSGTSAFPRTIQINSADGDTRAVTVESEPQAIAALDYESAEVAAELGLADRLVLVPEAVTNEALGGHVDELSEVPHTIPVAMDLEAESVIALSPDLVLMSPRHGAEERIGTVLEQAGTTTLELPASWTNLDSAVTNIDLIGQATGADAAAEQLIDELETGLGKTVEAGADAPRVLMLTNQAGRPFIVAGNAFPLELLERAGGVSVSDELGMTVTGAISPEQILDADPDGIMLIDMNGTGERLFSELLNNPAIAALPAAQDPLLVQGRDVQALGLTHTINGLGVVQEWLTGLGS